MSENAASGEIFGLLKENQCARHAGHDRCYDIDQELRAENVDAGAFGGHFGVTDSR